MRLLKFGSHGELCLTKNLIDDIPRYAILSHTWGVEEEEVTYRDLKAGLGQSKAGYDKIRFCGEQAQNDCLDYFWVDTCCIDQENQVELTEAITSMFRWYYQAVKCYVYLADVADTKRDSEGADLSWECAFRNSRWFTRGWTLQELIAPKQVEFYSRNKKFLGDKMTLQQEIHEITQIPVPAIRGVALSAFTPDERMRWAAKRSTKRPEDRWYCLLGIFNVYMPPIYGEGENAFIRLKDEIGKSLVRHLDAIGQIPSTSSLRPLPDSSIEAVSNIENEIFKEDRRTKLLTSISFDQMDSRRIAIRSAYSSTCSWLLQHRAYTDWTDLDQFHQHCGFLWINGKPGAGKSTLIKFAHANAVKNRPECEIIISFFFNARGDLLEKSTNGMYRALLFQLLKQAPDLQEVFDDFSFIFEHVPPNSWAIDDLCALLTSAVARLGQRRLKCFIDALDECDEQQVQEMIVFLEDLGQCALENKTQIHTCFASRHYPTIDVRNGRQLVLEDEHGHDQDLAKYIQRHLRAGRGKHAERTKAQVQEKANGVFMWVVLVIPILNKEFCNGRIFAVQKRLQEIPVELSSLFNHILRRDTDNMTDFLLCLQWILFARRPLGREEFYFAMLAGLDQELESLHEWDSENITIEQMDRFVSSSSKGLAEVTKSSPPRVQFIHESVRDFLIKDGGLCELWPELKQNLHDLSHDRLKLCCLKYLTIDLPEYVPTGEDMPKASSESAEQLRRKLTTSFPFLEYANRFVLEHADEAAQGVEQDDFIMQLDLSKWIKIHNLLARYNNHQYTPNVTFVYILAEYNCARLIKVARFHGWQLEVKGERYRYPLFVAFAKGHREAARALLQHDEGKSSEDVLAGINFGGAFSTPKGLTPLLWALENGHCALAEALVTVPGVNLSALNRDRRDALCVAAWHGYTATVRHIIARIESATQSAPDTVAQRISSYNHALRLASSNGHDQVVRILLEEGLNGNVRTASYDLALSYASRNGHEQVVRALLNAGANADPQVLWNRNPLFQAMIGGHDNIIRILLDSGAGIETWATEDCGDLWTASYLGYTQVAQMLIEAMKANDRPKIEYNDALLVASRRGNTQIVGMLLEAGADVNASGGISYGEALQAASARGYERIVQMLTEAKAKANARDADAARQSF